MAETLPPTAGLQPAFPAEAAAVPSPESLTPTPAQPAAEVVAAAPPAASVLTPAATGSKGPARILLTGKTGAGKSWLAAETGGALVDTAIPILGLIERYFGKLPNPAAMAAQIRAWGDGLVSLKYPATVERMLFVDWIRGKHDGMFLNFGTPGFWATLALSEADIQTGRVVITDVKTPLEFQKLTDAGFIHYHVTCSNATWAARPKSANSDDGLAIHLDNSAVKKTSLQPAGEMLRCVWNDTVARPSPRLHTVASYLQAIALDED
jgi:hypothetical protein